MSELLPAARAWVVDAEHPHARHLLRTEDWAVEGGELYVLQARPVTA